MTNALVPHTTRSHAVFSPSSAHRWMNCPASIFMEKDIPNVASSYAEEGTKAHEYMEACVLSMLGNTEKDTVIRNTEHLYGEEIGACAKVYLEAISECYFEEPEDYAVEFRVNLSNVVGMPDTFGSADFLMVSGGDLFVFDYKHGQGVKVSAEENPQMMLYALGALDSWEPAKSCQNVHLCIVQPRINNVSRWSTTVARLNEWRVGLMQSVVRAYDVLKSEKPQENDFNPSPATCKFCRARKNCPAVTGAITSIVHLPEKLPVPTDPVALAKAYTYKNLVMGFFDDVEKAVFQNLSDGVEVPGFKLVVGREGNRAWDKAKDVEEILKRMKIKEADMYDRKVISPTKAEKLAKLGRIGPRQWKELQESIVRPAGKPTIVEITDPRPALENDLSDVFKE